MKKKINSSTDNDSAKEGSLLNSGNNSKISAISKIKNKLSSIFNFVSKKENSAQKKINEPKIINATTKSVPVSVPKEKPEKQKVNKKYSKIMENESKILEDVFESIFSIANKILPILAIGFFLSGLAVLGLILCCAFLANFMLLTMVSEGWKDEFKNLAKKEVGPIEENTKAVKEAIQEASITRNKTEDYESAKIEKIRNEEYNKTLSHLNAQKKQFEAEKTNIKAENIKLTSELEKVRALRSPLITNGNSICESVSEDPSLDLSF